MIASGIDGFLPDGFFCLFFSFTDRILFGLAVTRFRGLLGWLVCIEIGRLQWWRSRLAFLAFLSCRFLFAALQAIAHPFTHVQACNTDGQIGAIRRKPPWT